MDVVLIPAFEPDSVLIDLAREFKEKGLRVLIVNDGSGEKYDNIFASAAEFATITGLEKNCGKGAALKCGMRYIRDFLPECENFVTCDADGQHKVEDVLRVIDRLHKGEKFVLTIRQRKKNIPLRSKVGNNLSRFVYALLTNRYLSDNQSGLRGFSKEHLDWMIEVEKNNYDYEMNVLYYAAKMGLKISTIPIEAIYIGNNESSHFSPVKDTIRIYKSLYSLARGTIFSFLAVEIMILILSFTLGYNHLYVTIGSVGAISFLITVLLNKFFFFKKIHYYDFFATLGYTVISYFVYTLFCIITMFTFPTIPLFITFNIIYIICIPLRYYLHKLIFLASLTKD